MSAANRVADLTERADADIDVIALNGMFFTASPKLSWRRGAGLPAVHPPHCAAAQGQCGAEDADPRILGGFTEIHNHSHGQVQAEPAVEVLWGDGTRSQTDPELPLWRQLRNGDVEAVSHRLAQYNHYGLKSPDSFALRRAGGGARWPRPMTATPATPTPISPSAIWPRRRRSPSSATPSEVAAVMAQMLAVDKVRRRHRKAEKLYAERAGAFRDL